MSHELTVAWVVGAGALLAAQAPINNGLGRSVGNLPAALASFIVGLCVLVSICLVTGDIGQFSSIGDAAFPTLFGGLIGATYVATATVTISRIGAGAVAAATIAGQLTWSLFIDEFGWVGVDTIQITGLRVFGAVLLLLGTVLVVHRKEFLKGVDGAGRVGLLALLTMMIAGGLVGFQPPLNAELADHIGGFNTALVNSITGGFLLAVIVLFTGQGGRLKRVTQARWYYLTGGLIGVVIVVTGLTAVETIGAAGLTAAIVMGQLFSSVLLDRVGAFGLERRDITLMRLAGVGLLVLGTFLTVS